VTTGLLKTCKAAVKSSKLHLLALYMVAQQNNEREVTEMINAHIWSESLIVMVNRKVRQC